MQREQGSKFFSVSGSIVLILLLALLSSADAFAASQLKCLEEATGKTLRWDPVWESDCQDRDVEYSVVSVTSQNRMPDRIVTLELKAAGKAAKTLRRLTVQAEDTARPICERLANNVRMIDKSIFDAPTELARDDKARLQTAGSDLPFIEYTSDGWVRADPPSNQPLVECRILDRRYSCLEEQKTRFGNALKSIEEEILYKP